MTTGTSKDAIVPVNNTVTSLLCFSIPSSCVPPGGYSNSQLLQSTTCWCRHILPISWNSGYNGDTKLPWCRRSVVEDTESSVASLIAHGSSGYRVRLGSRDVAMCSSKCRIGAITVFSLGRPHKETSPVSMREQPREAQYIIKDGNPPMRNGLVSHSCSSHPTHRPSLIACHVPVCAQQ